MLELQLHYFFAFRRKRTPRIFKLNVSGNWHGLHSVSARSTQTHLPCGLTQPGHPRHSLRL